MVLIHYSCFFAITIFYLLNGALTARFEQVKMDTITLLTLFKGYINHFSYTFLFEKGDINFPGQFITRHSIAGMGQLYLFQLPFLIIGLGGFYFKKYKKPLSFIILFLVIYPLGSVLASVNPQATRSVIGVVPFQILTAAGIFLFVNAIRQYHIRIIAITILIFVIGSSLIRFIPRIQTYPHYAADFWGWQYGARDIVKYFAHHQYQYDEIYMEGAFNAPEIFFKFYALNNCKNCFIGVPHEKAKPYAKQLFAVTPFYLTEHEELKLSIKKEILFQMAILLL